MDILTAYLLIFNAAAFLLMLADKHRAQKNTWRIPERTLLLTALMGGSLGAWIAVRLLHHKTKKPAFSLGIPMMLGIHCLILIFLYSKTA